MLDIAENLCNAESHGSTTCNIKLHVKASEQCGQSRVYLSTAIYKARVRND